MKKTKELREMTTAELQQELGDARKELFELRQKQVSGQIENPLRIRSVRRSVARLKTMMNQAGQAKG